MRSHSSPPSQTITRPQWAQSRTGFTLVELLVVIAILAIAALISIPSIVYLMKDTATSQAVVQMQAALAEARGLAITTHAPAAAIFYEDPGATSQSSVFYATAAPGQGDPTLDVPSLPYIFITDNAIQTQTFPKGIYVAGYVGPFAMNSNPSQQMYTGAPGSSPTGSYTGQINDSNSQSTGYLFPDPQALGQLFPTGTPTTTNAPSSADPLRVVVFLPNGRSVICPNFAVVNVPQDNPQVTPPAGAIYYGPGPSCVGLSVYDAAQLSAAQTASQGALGSYLVPNPSGTPKYATAVPLYIVNSYTGSLIGGTP
jgi:prepilin-type N-terminal cleavage/methylation domain-containing protein